MTQPRQKRRLLINKNLQLTILLYSIVLALWTTVFNLLFQTMYANHVNSGNGEGALIFVFIAVFVIMTSTVLFGLLLTARIAGPIHKLRRHMDEFAEGKSVDKIILRKDDYFEEIIAPYNKIIAELTDKRLR